MRRLSDCAQGRDNNFNLIRIVAALSVLVGHSYALTGRTDPWVTGARLASGAVAVDIFFATSGFLVVGSLLRRQDVGEFVLARALRVFPGLWTVLLLIVFVLGPVFTTLPLGHYFADPHTWIYPARCAVLFFGVSYTVPGVFEHNPTPKMVNGSLWTLTDEVRLYAILALVWFVLRRIPGPILARFRAVIAVFALLAGGSVLWSSFGLGYESYEARHYYMFFTGAMFFILRERIMLSHRAFWLIVAVFLVATLLDGRACYVVYLFTLAYVLLYLAYVPGGLIRNYNRLGDYSYGVYIYAFPVQQSIVALFPGVPPLGLLAASGLISLGLAALSWHLLEKRALGLKSHLLRWRIPASGTMELKPPPLAG